MQGSIALHFLVVAHPNYNSQGKFNLTESNNFEYHSCTYHLYDNTPLIFVKSLGKKLSLNHIQGLDLRFCCLKDYVHRPGYNFLLRGPPIAVEIPEY